jgi:membrane fusion protein (multidrug efflux system)
VADGLAFQNIFGLHHEDTDDAQIEANISPVIPRGRVCKEVRVKDNQMVMKAIPS